MFRPRYLPAGIWLQVDKYTEGVLAEELFDMVAAPEDLRRCDEEPGFIGPKRDAQWWEAQQAARARGLFLLPVTTDYFKFQSHGVHPVKRSGFTVTHAAFHTSTSVQGHTIRTGVTIDCARIPPQGSLGMSDEAWWFHLYAMLSLATRMGDLLLLRPPLRSCWNEALQPPSCEPSSGSSTWSATRWPKQHNCATTWDLCCRKECRRQPPLHAAAY